MVFSPYSVRSTAIFNYRPWVPVTMVPVTMSPVTMVPVTMVPVTMRIGNKQDSYFLHDSVHVIMEITETQDKLYGVHRTGI